MEKMTNALAHLSSQLDQLSTSMAEVQQRIARLRQDSIWDINMLRQEMATEQNLKNLGRGLASKQDLSQVVDSVCRRIAALRFESHQEHQELMRFIDEGPCDWIGRRQPAPAPPETPRTHERSATLTMDRVLDIDEVSAKLEPTGPRITLAKACAQGGRP